jgi:hypothetical protein
LEVRGLAAASDGEKGDKDDKGDKGEQGEKKDDAEQGGGAEAPA